MRSFIIKELYRWHLFFHYQSTFHHIYKHKATRAHVRALPGFGFMWFRHTLLWIIILFFIYAVNYLF